MAISKGIPRRRRLPVISNTLMIDTVRGVLRVRKWPRKRGRPKSALQRWWIDWFEQANLLAKYVSAADATQAIRFTKDSGLYPRDIILKAMRGRLYWWTDQTGWKWFPVAAIGDISLTLDVLAQTVGDVLVRATDRWRNPTGGASGKVLTHQGAGNPPIWATPIVGSGSQAFTPLDGDLNPTGAQASQGWLWTPARDTVINACFPFVNAVLNSTYQASLVTLAGGLIATVVARTGVTPPQPAGPFQIDMPFAVPPTAVAGTLHAILATRTDAGAGTNSGVRRQSGNPVPIPSTGHPSRCSVVSLLPAVGQAYATTGGQPWTANLLYSI